jgi:hypothetical protein
MMRRHFAAVLVLTLAACSHAPAQSSVATPSRSPVATAAAAPAAPAYLDRFASEIDAFDAADPAHPHAPGGNVVLGHKNIRFMNYLPQDLPGLPVIRRGFRG